MVDIYVSSPIYTAGQKFGVATLSFHNTCFSDNLAYFVSISVLVERSQDSKALLSDMSLSNAGRCHDIYHNCVCFQLFSIFCRLSILCRETK